MDIIQPDKTHILVDSRPSDAIAIALKAKAPIYVSESVMSIAGQIITEEQSLEDLSEKKREKMAKHETVLKPSEVMELEKKMQEAIKLENYEQAAQLRDQINEINRKKLKNSGEQSNVQG
jgi:bifunctional DNase/RNase